jgi:UDP-N-acetylglucosamine 2-epimerase (non-hydrolysing)
MSNGSQSGTPTRRPILLVAGARPNFMKVAPILHALEARGAATCLVHTGQHYDAQMSDAFFTDLGLRTPDHSLGVGSGSHAQQTARVMEAFDPVLEQVRPAWVVVVGDVNSTLACALVASKRRTELDTRIAHVEAGLRSDDWRMPEEVNRVLTDRLADLLLTPSTDAAAHLAAEGIAGPQVQFVGNVMIDALHAALPSARARDLPGRLELTEGGYVVSTLHRPSNVDDPAQLATILAALRTVARDKPVVLPLHPRTRARLAALGPDAVAGLTMLDPLGYVEMLSLTAGAAAVLTDSGGLQEETTVLGVPCVTLREQTERPVTITEGTNRMAVWPLTTDGIVASARTALATARVPVGSRVPAGWDGRAAERIAAALLD